MPGKLKSNRSVFFHYKQGNTFLHKLSSSIKIPLMLLLSLASFYIPVIPGFIVYGLLLILSLTYFCLTPGEILSDNKPGLIYVFMVYLVCVVSNICFLINNPETSFLELFKFDSKFLPMTIHVLLSLEITSIFFRVTTVVQFTQGFESLEKIVFRKSEPVVAPLLSLTITFLPGIVSYWNRLCFAWKARGGKENIIKIKKLFPFLFKSNMNEAYLKAMARMNRM